MTEGASGSLPSKRRPATRGRWAAAFVVAVASDALDAMLFPFTGEGILSPIHDVLDAATALALILLLGFRWPMALVILPEAVPALSLFPSWTAVLGAMALGDGVGTVLRRK